MIMLKIGIVSNSEDLVCPHLLLEWLESTPFKILHSYEWLLLRQLIGHFLLVAIKVW